MLVSEISEFELINRIQKIVSPQNETSIESIKKLGHDLILSIDDDAAVFKSSHTSNVITTDALVENVHFNLEWTTFQDLGWKSIISSQSDIASMGCKPTFATITLGLRPDLPVDGILQLYQGMSKACHELGGTIIGGDIVASETFFISVTMNGSLPIDHTERQILYRNKLLPGDLLCVTGTLGSSAAGLHILKNPNLMDFNSSMVKNLIESHLHPSSRVSEGAKLAKLGVKAAMDISDGLMTDLKKMCSSSNVGANIILNQIPISPDLKILFPNDWIEFAVSGGEDYELLFSGNEKIISLAQKTLNTQINIIGKITSEKNNVTLVDSTGKSVVPTYNGWDHFKSQEG